MSFKRHELLTASEVARYVYCQRAWWFDRSVRVRPHRHWRRKLSLVGLILTMLGIVIWLMVGGIV
jgi:hypothetical protein